MNKAKLKKITSARLFLPIVCLIAVLLINVIKTPDFFNITIRNGVLYGYVIDVINRHNCTNTDILSTGCCCNKCHTNCKDYQFRCSYGGCSSCMLSDLIWGCIFRN